ncbi:protein mono-ADP-ribosyltransferase PARP12 isoform X2 [Myripristis murdjan]|uniref:protein mono-ADP-ribosyltransferase PARP12 isoform X2 n=1 Tax=Myripristis murdjan TaxID=586833 RepID=UPI0011760F34|nr:protein mono-ADP-ribosyltransferase PARP12 isoform X2 [Myripristis murdjan]
MSSTVSRFVVKKLCENGGSLDYQRLHDEIKQHFTVAESVFHGVLRDDDRIAIQEGSQKALRNHIVSPDSLIVAKTPLRLCQRLPKECPGCDKLHLCRYLVCGSCRYGDKCKNSHCLTSPCNIALLMRFGLQELTEKQLFQLLLQNDPYLLPEICSHYNKGNGEHGSCTYKTSCTNLHLCQHFVQGDCKFGPACKRAHNISGQNLKILSGRGISRDNLGIINKIYRNRFIILGQQERQALAAPAPPVPTERTRHPSKGSTRPADATNPISEADRNEICLYFIRRSCSFREKCVRVHYHLPYRWQVLESDGVTWKDLPNMEDIEEAYCDPRKNTNCTDQSTLTPLALTFLSLQPSPASQSVNFVTMTYGGRPVRRLSTASSGSKPPHIMFTTQWLWYWKDENEKWVEYGNQGGGVTPASITSETLENVYLEERQTEIAFGAGKQKYILYFKSTPGSQLMYQQNIQYQTRREVRRRPRFVSAQEVENKLKGGTSSDSSGSTMAEAVPAHWDKSPMLDLSYRLVPLSKSMKDYIMIEKLFKSTMTQSTITSIERIQSPSLWQLFQWQKDKMKKKNGGKPVNEQYLFHGTDESLIEAICEQNFDWRVCGVHGTAYGKGSYFARDASYSDKYARAKGCVNKIMFVALVLVGESTRGSGSYVRPPAKGANSDLYDSCVDSVSNPSIFVIFDKLQIYPEYIIRYS